MTSFLLKVIAAPLSVVAAAWVLTNVNYTAFYQPIIVGLVIAVLGVMMEGMLLREGTVWVSTVFDFVIATLIVYFLTNWFVGAEATFFGAVIVGAWIGVVEHVVHLWLVRSGRTQQG